MLKNKKQLNNVFSLLFIFSPLIGVVLLCAFQGNSFSNIFLPNSLWGDELLYFKQIEAIIHFGIPHGYFGYNETPASLLTFGAWSPMLLLPHVVLGSLFGWSIYSPIIYNLVMVIFSLAIFVILTSPSLYQKICLSIFVCSYTFLSRFIVSSMMEALNFSALILLLSLFLYIIEFSKSSISVYFYLGIALYFTMSRPYYVVFIIPVLVYCFLKKKYTICFVSIFFSLFALVSFYWIEKNLLAPRFEQGLTPSTFDIFTHNGLFGVVEHYINLIASGFVEMFTLFYYEDVFGMTSIIYFFTLCQILMLVCASTKVDKTRREVKLALIAVAFTIILLIVIMFCFYPVYNGARHIAPMAFVSVFIVARYSKEISVINVALSFIFFVFLAPFGKTYNYNFDIPFGTAQDFEAYTEISQEMFNIMKNPISENSWDNTVAFLSPDYDASNATLSDSPYRPLYSIPAGYGINYLDIDNYKTDHDLSDIMSGYIITFPKNAPASTPLLSIDNYVLIKN